MENERTKEQQRIYDACRFLDAGRMENGINCLREAIEYARASDCDLAPIHWTAAHVMLAQLYFEDEKNEQAREELRQYWNVLETRVHGKIEFDLWDREEKAACGLEANLAFRAADEHWKAGERDEIEEALRKAVDFGRRSGDSVIEAWAWCRLSELLTYSEREDEARRLLAKVQELIRGEYREEYAADWMPIKGLSAELDAKLDR